MLTKTTAHYVVGVKSKKTGPTPMTETQYLELVKQSDEARTKVVKLRLEARRLRLSIDDVENEIKNSRKNTG